MVSMSVSKTVGPGSSPGTPAIKEIEEIKQCRKQLKP